MKNKKILVLLKYFKGELNPFDGAALECALETGSKQIIALTMAPPHALGAFKGITRLGVKCVMISDSLYAGSDTQATSFILAEAIKRFSPDLIFCGRQSVDGDTGQVPPMLSGRLGYEIKSRVIDFSAGKIVLRNGESFIPQDKTIISFEKIRVLRFPSIFSKVGEVEVLDNSVLNLPKEKCGLKGSPTRVVKSYESSVGRRACSFVSADKLTDIIDASLKKQREEDSVCLSEKLGEVYFVGNIKAKAEAVGKRAIELVIEGKSLSEIAEEVKGKTVLWEDAESLKITASKVAVIVGAGICADCISFRAENGKLIMTRPALGGNVTADIVCEGETAFATVRTVKSEASDVIFAVGKGAVDYLDKIKALADRYGAEVCCTRIVADSGRLPYEKQVGLTGRMVSPKVYVAFGISGAVQHTCAIAGAGTVIAVNADKQARIFDYADYGIVSDVSKL